MTIQRSQSENLLDLFLKCFRLLSKRDRLLVTIAGLIQISLIMLELLGLILIGGIVAVTTSAVQGRELPNLVGNAISLLNLDSLTPQSTAAIFGIGAAAALILKSVLSYYLGLRNFAFLARREATIAGKLAEKALSLSVSDLNRFTTPQYQHAMTIGSSSVMGGVIGQSISLMTELALQASMLITLFFFSPGLTLLSLIFFGGLFVFLNKYQGSKARLWGRGMTDADIESTSKIADAIGSYREMIVMNRRDFFVDRISMARQKSAQFQVNKTMLTQFSKYVFETSLVIAGLGIAAYAFLTRPVLEAASLVAIFLTAATRIAPSVLKVQQGVLALRGAAGATEVFFLINNHLESCSTNTSFSVSVEPDSIDSNNVLISVENLSITYPEARKPAIKNVNMEFKEFSNVAIVGPSGAGKSTLIDAILGVINPNQGQVRRLPKSSKYKTFRVSYVPQFVYLASGSVIENVCLGLPTTEYDLLLAEECLRNVRLWDWVETLPKKLNESVGERGSRLSGGQRQRLGIARALYQRPDLLILDEATSSLDADSEFLITEALESLRSKVTTIIIAHRLSTVMKCDKITYMRDGEIVAEGTFSELRKSVPDFDRQANLMGIAN